MSAEMRGGSIELVGVRKTFGPKVVLDHIDLKVEPGESLVVIGGSGTGKSVMLKCVLGILPIDGGTIRLDGVDLAGASRAERTELRNRIGMLFQGGALFDSLPVWRNITFALTRGRATNAKAMHAKAVDLLAKVGLDAPVADLKPSELSGGMQKRVALARAIAAEPEIIFFDEPTTGLDPIRADTINRLIRSLVTDLGVTAVTITHDMASARRIADRVAMLKDGRIHWEGKVADLENSGNDYVDRFVHGRAEDGEAG
ncbi:ATP-binding cassette domain-containing protein [Sphingosinicella sp.]|jgi:phospholipid/cholesterol/gamma-HCH transport system ATP-binding protein|uniref:ABC transporter ATP-binding protein n=1 Tax=Sphingosinicella sp. TaxID=1917971 RepID=UPI00181BCA67|nr:ATP-binding cassette domain-containing protein [Sphingosinicella sp.]MBA4756863.1 ATP-binding cassette domain-containing protein [Sphingosinicella sp.]MEA3538618.1 ATP-binding cassette domain-containing protein [Pseudomonadota bacterium]